MQRAGDHEGRGIRARPCEFSGSREHFGQPGMPAGRDLTGTNVHIDPCRGLKLCFRKQCPQLFSAGPKAGRKRGRTRINIVPGHNSIERHQTAHGGAGDQRILPAGQCPVSTVNELLQRPRHPVHRPFPESFQMPEPADIHIPRRIFIQAAVPLMVAFDSSHDQGQLCPGQIFLHSPALPVSRMAVIEHIVPVKHIQHRIIQPGCFIIPRQINIQASRLFRRKPGNPDLRYSDHWFLLVLDLRPGITGTAGCSGTGSVL